MACLPLVPQPLVPRKPMERWIPFEPVFVPLKGPVKPEDDPRLSDVDPREV